MEKATSSLARWFALIVLATPALCAGARADPLSEGARAYAAEHPSLPRTLLRSRAERGDRRAQTDLGLMYLRGEGVPQSYQAAFGWLRRAARSDEPTAQYFLGLLYDRGLGVTQDFVLAEAWLDLAVAKASPARRRDWAPIRDAVAAKIPRDQLAQAQRLAAEWRSRPTP